MPRRPKKAPRIPSALVDLATPISVDLEGEETLEFPKSGNFSMAASLAGKELWIISCKRSKKVRATDVRGERLYETFTGFEHDDIAKLVNVTPKQLIRIGRAVNIVYRSDKFSRPGNYSEYVHSFRKYPTVSVDNKKRPTVVVLRGGAIKVKQEGITG